MARLRVLVVEDSLTVRRRLCEVLSADREIEIVGEANDGKRGVQLCSDLRPDVVTLDMLLPIMSGLAATEYIMAHFPTPILIVSSSTNRGDLFKTYDALAAGAVDVLEKPSGNEIEGQWEEKFLAAVKLVSRIKVITHPRARLGDLGRPPRTLEPLGNTPGGGSFRREAAFAPEPERAVARRNHRIVALGASTGGPGAIVDVLRTIPAPLPVPTIVVLHIGEPFGTAFAEWLDAQTPHRVAQARGGEPLASLDGKVMMAPAGRHVVVRDGALCLTSDPERHSCRPSIDVLFESLALEYGDRSIACLLTGMGRDGAAGLLKLKRTGALTIAQDESTSVVYGMPREAVLLGAAERVLPLARIGPTVAEHLGLLQMANAR